MPAWLHRIIARIPHPGYGACGGAWQDCSQNQSVPKDEMDRAFLEHDADLFWAHQQSLKSEENRLIQEANWTLGENLRKIDPSKLNWYGKIYRFFAMIVFQPKPKFNQ